MCQGSNDVVYVQYKIKVSMLVLFHSNKSKNCMNSCFTDTPMIYRIRTGKVNFVAFSVLEVK